MPHQLADLAAWFGDNQTVFWWLVPLSVATFVGSLIAVPIVVARIPADYFTCDEQMPTCPEHRHPVAFWTLIVLKNLLGVVLVIGGVMMLALPGQGLLTILLGVLLLNFPGKRELELSIIRRSAIRRAVNWIRRKAGREPLRIPAPKRNRLPHQQPHQQPDHPPKAP
jgi:hypothetical protein